MAIPILIADDSATIRLVVRFALDELGVPVELVEARDGVEALALLRAQPIALALIDLHMPELDGFGVLRALRAESGRLHELPVLLLTAGCSDERRQELLAAGANTVLEKPFTRPLLLEAVRRQLGMPASR